MKIVTNILLLGVLLLSFTYAPSIHAQDTNCNAELLEDVETHEIAMYMLAEIEKPNFDRQVFVVAILVYANKLTITDERCGLSIQAALLSWSFEVYRAKANHYLKIIDDEQYVEVQLGLITQRDLLYTMYCAAFPITCVDGLPLSYAEFIDSIKPTPNSPL